MSFEEDLTFLDGLSTQAMPPQLAADGMPDFDSMTFEDTVRFVEQLSDDEKRNMLESMKDKQPSLVTLPGPQTLCSESEADLTLYGGAAGGGKTFLAVILALTKHIRTLMIRKEASQLYAVQDEIEGIMGGRDGFNSQNGIWRLPNNEITDPYGDKPSRQIRFGGLNKPGDAAKYQGAPRDLLLIDEAANISYEEFVFLTVWERTAVEGQRTRTILCSNPPTDATGMWMVRLFAPWLDPDHPNPAKDGELRWFITVGDEDVEVLSEEEIEIDGQFYSPQSRTFISAKVDDNPHMIASGYKKKLQRLPTYLRDRMLHGKFLASLEDDAMQVIPTDWVDLAIQRHKDEPSRADRRMTSMGVDPARGGADEMTIAPLHLNWFAPLIKIPGIEVPNGPLGAAEVIKARRDGAPVKIDAIGVGTSVYDKLDENNIDVEAMIGNGKTDERSKDGLFSFKNKRALWYWRMREALDPESGNKCMLPPDNKMKQDLCAFTYKVLDGNIIQVESKDAIKIRLRRSPDAGDSVIYANANSATLSDLRKGSKQYKVKRAIGGTRR
jgi:hypothetical protein